MNAMKSVLCLSLSLAAVCAVAQNTSTSATVSDSDIALLRSDVQADRTAIVTHTMALTDDQAKPFWPLYREYVAKQQTLGDQRVSIIKDYADSYATMDDAKANDLMTRQLKYNQERVKLTAEYYPKFRKAIGAKLAAKFIQVDTRLNMLVDVQLSSAIPIIQ